MAFPFASSMLSSILVCVLLGSLTYAHSHGNGMDMSMDGAMDLASGSMVPWLHFAPGDILLFYGWVPTSKGAMVGTCIGLFLLALVDRWIAACRSVMEVHWNKRAQIAQADRLNIPRNSGEKKRSVTMPGRVRDAITMRSGLPFILAHDIPRGLIHGAQSLIHFAIMLIIMTFQAAFIISIVVGLGVGEALFGRFGSHAAHHG